MFGRVIVIMISLDAGLLDGLVHPLDLSAGPRMVDLGAAVFDAVFPAALGERAGDMACRGSIGRLW